MLLRLKLKISKKTDILNKNSGSNINGNYSGIQELEIKADKFVNRNSGV
jgi:hypothetical protein